MTSVLLESLTDTINQRYGDRIRVEIITKESDPSIKGVAVRSKRPIREGPTRGLFIHLVIFPDAAFSQNWTRIVSQQDYEGEVFFRFEFNPQDGICHVLENGDLVGSPTIAEEKKGILRVRILVIERNLLNSYPEVRELVSTLHRANTGASKF